MKRQRPRLIFIGCEGESERGYARFLGNLASSAGLNIGIRTEDLGGGDAKTCLDRAIREAKAYRSGGAGRNTQGFVFLDEDRADGLRDKLDRAAADARLTIIWQSPCHEALLLRHFAGQDQALPPNCELAGEKLRKLWSGYEKATPALRIAKTLTLQHVQRAAAVTPELRKLLDVIGL